MPLTREQQKALALDKNISVTAGAGSGKTTLLVERFLKIALQSPSGARAILAITFTKKAAGEMQERTAEEVNRRLEKAASAEERTRLLQIRDQLSMASISTIHGFCARVLREFPIEAGLPPDFSEMDDFQQRTALHAAIDQTFTRADQNEGVPSPRLFASMEKASVEEMLFLALKAPYEMKRLFERFATFTAKEYHAFLEEHWLRLLRDFVLPPTAFNELMNLIQFILDTDTIPEKTAPGHEARQLLKKTAAFNNGSEPEREAYRSIFELSVFFTSSQNMALKSVKNFGGKSSWNQQNQKQLVELSTFCAAIEERKKAINPGFPDDENDRLWFDLMGDFFTLYKEAETVYKNLKAERGWLDFEDLQILTLHLLQENETVRQTLARRFDYLMVDEFQDTNALQWEIVSQLATEKEGLAKDKIFIVGDPKQSIYGFRNADIRIFNRVKKQFAALAGASADEGDIVFGGSFRFLPRLNAFINYLFGGVLRESASDPFKVGYHPLKAMRHVPNTGWAELALLDEEDTEEEYMARSIARLKEEQVPVFVYENGETQRPFEYGDAAILMRSRDSLLKIEQALRTYDIPYQTVKGIGFWQKQEVYDFYHLLRFLNNPQDDLSLVGVLRSPLFMLSDEALYFLAQAEGSGYLQKMSAAANGLSDFPREEKENLIQTLNLLRKWTTLRGRMPLTDFCETIMDDLKLRTLYLAQLNGEQLTANIEKLIQQVSRFEAAGLGSLNEFVTNMEELIESGMREGEAQLVQEDRGSVKIMTIHAAKGLQFPVVFVPYLNKGSGKNQSAVYLDAELGLAIKPAAYGTESSLLYDLLRQRRKQKESAEARRIFYTAVTRAACRVYLSARLKKKKALPGSALEWMTERFDSLLEAERVQIGWPPDSDGQTESGQSGEVENPEAFELVIVHGLEKEDRLESSGQTFIQGMRLLEKTLQKPTPPASMPDYVQKIPPGSGSRVFSPTRLMIFQKDKREYYRRYHLGFFDDDYEAFGEDIQRDEYGLLKGKIVHRYLELMPRSLIPEEQLIEQILFEFEVFEAQLQRRFYSELQQLKGKISGSETARKIVYAREAQNEAAITIRLGGDFLTGTLDRMYRNEAGIWEVVDYKTNRVPAGQVEREAARYSLQLQAYALLVSKIYPGQKEYAVSLYFLHPDKLHTQRYTPRELTEIESAFSDIIHRIKEEFPVY